MGKTEQPMAYNRSMNWIYLIIEFIDKLVCGVSQAAWPAIQVDLRLNYTQIGVLMTVPSLVSTIVEPFLGVLGDVWKRRLLILGGGAVFVLSLGFYCLAQLPCLSDCRAT
jgi:FSR family fosmidomycin resistance protein-like MFS transporter